MSDEIEVQGDEELEAVKSIRKRFSRRNLFQEYALDPNETYETSRARVMKGIAGRIPASKFEQGQRQARRLRKLGHEFADTSKHRAEGVMGNRMLHALVDPKGIAKRRAKKLDSSRASRFEIRSELLDTPLGRRLTSEGVRI